MLPNLLTATRCCRFSSLFYIFRLALSLSLFSVSARQFNVTIDDQEGDPTNGNRIIYTPQGGWNIGQNCSACTAKATPQSDAYLGTWMDATYNPNGTISNGVPGEIIQASVGFVGEFSFLILRSCAT